MKPDIYRLDKSFWCTFTQTNNCPLSNLIYICSFCWNKCKGFLKKYCIEVSLAVVVQELSYDVNVKWHLEARRNFRKNKRQVLALTETSVCFRRQHYSIQHAVFCSSFSCGVDFYHASSLKYPPVGCKARSRIPWRLWEGWRGSQQNRK